MYYDDYDVSQTATPVIEGCESPEVLVVLDQLFAGQRWCWTEQHKQLKLKQNDNIHSQTSCLQSPT